MNGAPGWQALNKVVDISVSDEVVRYAESLVVG